MVSHSDDSTVKEDTAITELNIDSQVNMSNTEDDLPFIDSKNDSLVDTNEFLEFVDTLDTGEQTADIEPKSVTESQFSFVMSYHEGDFTPFVRCNLAMHRSVTHFVIRQPIWRPCLLERVYKPMHTSH